MWHYRRVAAETQHRRKRDTSAPRANASARAHAYTKERILDGSLGAGEVISEGEIAEAIGTSRTPVREAFLRLECEGLLRLYPKRGALVVPISHSEVESVMETRLLIERFALSKVIALGIDLAAPLAQVIARQRELRGGRDRREFVEADRQMHRLIVAATGNEIILQLHDSMRDRQSRIGLIALARQDRRVDEIIEEHAAIAAALGAAEEQRALALLDRHLHATLMLLRGPAYLRDFRIEG